MIQNNKLLKITFSAMMMALYIIIMSVTQWFEYGLVQIRFATSLYTLVAIFPFLVIPLSIANALGNYFFGKLGILDVFFGFIIGFVLTTFILYLKKRKLNDWVVALPIMIIPALFVPIYLAPLLTNEGEEITYFILMISILIGQIIPFLSGVFFIKVLRKRKITFKSLKSHNRILNKEKD